MDASGEEQGGSGTGAREREIVRRLRDSDQWLLDTDEHAAVAETIEELEQGDDASEDAEQDSIGADSALDPGPESADDAALEGAAVPADADVEPDPAGQVGAATPVAPEVAGPPTDDAEDRARRRRERTERRRAPSARRRGGGIRRTRRRRRAALIFGLAIVAAAIVVALEGEETEPIAASNAVEEVEPVDQGEAQELARGGSRVLPNYEVVAYYGAPQAPELGVLGLTPPEEAVAALNTRAEEYAALTNKPIYPAFELISTVAQNSPGESGEYRFHQDESLIEDYLRVADENDFLLILDIQPGRADFVDEVKRLRPFLSNPNVGVALDPEWHLPKGVPGEEIGSVKASVINRVGELMSRQAREQNLPQKLLIVHQFTDEMIQMDEKLKEHPNVALVLNADGFGTPELKIGTYDRLAPKTQPPFAGFKLFFTEDTQVMSATQVLELQPRPKVVVYE